jgi:hypothetical protein
MNAQCQKLIACLFGLHHDVPEAATEMPLDEPGLFLCSFVRDAVAPEAPSVLEKGPDSFVLTRKKGTHDHSFQPQQRIFHFR